MSNKFVLFFVGLVVSVGLSFIGGELIPWGAGGLGLLVGLAIARGISFTAPIPNTGYPSLVLLALAIALYLIENQYYNPDWLSRVALFGRVYASHALLFPALFEARQRLNDL